MTPLVARPGGRRWQNASSLFIAALVLNSCRASFIEPRSAAGAHPQRTYIHFYLFGVIGDSQLDVRNWCTNGHAHAVRTSASIGTVLVSVGTLGIYTPRLVEIQCEARRAALSKGGW
jgi:hypothetical protein